MDKIPADAMVVVADGESARVFRNVGIGRETRSLMMMVTPHIIIQEEEEERLGTGR